MNFSPPFKTFSPSTCFASSDPFKQENSLPNPNPPSSHPPLNLLLTATSSLPSSSSAAANVADDAMKATTSSLFSKFHPHPLLQQQQLQLQQVKDPPDTSGDTTGSPQSPDVAAGGAKRPHGSPAAAGGGGGDGSSIEVSRRPRGRPPGSKNKPKPPVVITRDAPDSPNVMRPHILEIPPGHDVADALRRFARRRDLGLSVLAGTGAVSNVTLRHQLPHAASPPASAAATFPGRFEILSISATIVPPSLSPPSPVGGFSVSLAGPHGQVLGGAVAGPLVAAGTVTVVAAAFSSPSFHRLPADEDLAVSVSVSVSTDADHAPAGASPLPISSCHLLSDVIWAPAARPPPY